MLHKQLGSECGFRGTAKGSFPSRKGASSDGFLTAWQIVIVLNTSKATSKLRHITRTSQSLKFNSVAFLSFKLMSTYTLHDEPTEKRFKNGMASLISDSRQMRLIGNSPQHCRNICGCTRNGTCLAQGYLQPRTRKFQSLRGEAPLFLPHHLARSVLSGGPPQPLQFPRTTRLRHPYPR